MNRGFSMLENKRDLKFSVRRRIKSLYYVFNGLKILIKEEHNFRIHMGVSIGVIVVGFLLQISLFEWMVLFLAIGLVLSLEAINTVLENVSDYISPGYNEIIKRVKDISAAAVFISAFVSVAAGLMIFIPKIILICERVGLIPKL